MEIDVCAALWEKVDGLAVGHHSAAVLETVFERQQLPLAFPITDKRNHRRCNAEFFGDALAGKALREKLADFLNIVFRKLDAGVNAARRAKFVKGWIAPYPQAVSEYQSAKGWGYSSDRKLKAFGDSGAGFTAHSGLQNVVNDSVGYNSMRVGPSALRSRPQFFKRGISVDAELVAPRPARADKFDHMLRYVQSLSNLSAQKSIQSHSVNLRDGGFVDFCVRPDPTAALKPIISVLLRAAPSKVLGIAARRIVAAMQSHKAVFAWRPFGERERVPVGSNIFPVVPIDAVTPLVAMALPVPALILTTTVNLAPESIFFFHNRPNNMTSLTQQGIN